VQVSVVVPVYNALELVRGCLQSIFEAGSNASFEVLVVNNGSRSDVAEWLEREESIRPQVRHLYYAEPLGFARAVNAGAAKAAGETLIVLNSDTVVTPGWMEGLHDALKLDPSLGAVTPSTNSAGDPAQMDFNTVDLPLAKALALRAQKSKPKMLYLPQRITFFCVGFRIDVWRSMGGLDESYQIGNFEDDDFCLKLRMAGYRLGVAQHIFVFHHNNGTFHANRINHNDCSKQNATIFAARAREAAMNPIAPQRRWPKGTAHEVSVVIHPRHGASLERTLRSLDNQTVEGFEVVLPGRRHLPARKWTAHVGEGDVLYPFHVEALLDALDRTSSEAAFADCWVAMENRPAVHPDASRAARRNPLMIAGWMHRSTLDEDRLWEQCVPTHWPRLTWEILKAPVQPEPAEAPKHGFVEKTRRFYRRHVPYQTRVALDVWLRRMTGVSLLPGAAPDAEALLKPVAEQLEALHASGAEAGKFAAESALPAVIMFNAIAWHSAVQRQQNFARGLAREGHTVFWIETELRPSENWWSGLPFPEVAPRVHLVRLPGASRNIYHMLWSPGALDAMFAALILASAAYRLDRVVALVNYPRWQPIASRLRERTGWKLAYDCLDDQIALADLYQTQAGDYESLLADQADLVFTSSAVLAERIARHSPILLHNAADYDLFSSCKSMGHLQDLHRPLIGFFGALADWLDMDLIYAAGRRFPDWSFVYIGPPTFSNPEIEAKWFRSTNLPNIHVLPQMDHRQLAAHLAEFDVCTMPFLDIPVTRTMNAVKLYEYLAAGKPVVARDLPEVRHLLRPNDSDLIAVYSSMEEFFDRLIQALQTRTPEITAKRQAFAERNTWQHRVKVLSRKIVELFETPQDTSSISAVSKGSNTRSQE
jgi:GT2 family glycosyltransferase/glycosyltransferase involved in cell wall biosynthesis